MKKHILFVLLACTFLVKSQTYDWVALSQTVNKPVQSLSVYQNQLVAAGSFSIAGTLPVKRIASWDGSTWFSLGTGIKGGPVPSVYKLLSYNNELYACGRFDSAGSIATKNIAKWDGNNWSGFGTNTNDEIYSMAFYNGQLYAAGMFTVIGGVTAKNIAKWNGTQWQPVGNGVKYGVNINNLCVFQNDLYVTGNFDTIGNIACQNIAKWNGTSWSAVANGLPYGLGMHVWQNKLLLGANSSTVAPYPIEIWQWNGVSLSLFSQQTNAGGSIFLTSSTNKLYSASGSSNSPGKSTIWERNTVSSLWDSVGTGIQSVAALCEYNNEIYCAGFFNSSNGAQANYIAKLANTTGLNYLKSDADIKVYPNPFKENLKIEIEKTQPSQIRIFDSLGQTIYYSNLVSYQNIDLNTLPSGVYYLQLSYKSFQKVMKIIKS